MWVLKPCQSNTQLGDQDRVYFKQRLDLCYFVEDCEAVFIQMKKVHKQQNHNIIVGVIYLPNLSYTLIWW